MNPVLAAGTVATAVVLTHGVPWSVFAAVALPRPRALRPAGRHWRLAVIVPAHNEEAMLGTTLDSLLAAAGEPAAEIVVVADNCTDRTAAVARSRGVTVLERTDPVLRGKSHALSFALAHLAARPEPPEAVCFVDADTVVSETFFAAIAARLDAGAEAVQVHYEAAAGDSPLSQLRRLAFLLVHRARPLGMARLGLGTGLKGNGMALRWALVREGFAGSGITEDAAMTLALARRGVAVAFEPRAWVRGHMAGSYANARVQDERWEGGRFGLMRGALAAAVDSLRRGHPGTAAAALDVASLPLTLLGVLAVTGSVLVLVGGGPWRFAIAGPASLASYGVLGLAGARVSPRELGALLEVPRFVAHKLRTYAALAARRGPAGWERTSRR
ncbi:MAG: glycosyltransferase family 2 protein [Dehalococcoidia bacterium]